MPKDEKKGFNINDYILVPKNPIMNNYKIPKSMKMWGRGEKQSQEYMDMLGEISACVGYVAKLLNEGPEVNESVAKRTSTLKVVVEALLKCVFLNGFDKQGVLTEISNEMTVDRKIMMMANRAVSIQKKEDNKRGLYTA